MAVLEQAVRSSNNLSPVLEETYLMCPLDGSITQRPLLVLKHQMRTLNLGPGIGAWHYLQLYFKLLAVKEEGERRWDVLGY